MNRRPNILVMIPAGEVNDHDAVRWYRSIAGDLSRYYNVGDMFVYDSSLKLLEFEARESLRLRSTDDEIARYNAEFDYCFLRGSNYIHDEMDWGPAAEVLQKLTIPVIPFGIGAQAPAIGELRLSDQTIRVMRLLGDACEKVGVRGAYTAQVLSDLGVRNTEIIGCPTLYRHKQPELSIALPPLEEIEAVGYTMRREVGERYARDTGAYLRAQHEMILDLDRRFALTLITQGETAEKSIFYGAPDAEQAINDLIDEGWLSGRDDPLLGIYRSQMFFSQVVADYDDLVRKLDLVLGYRLHGNLIALANGTPAIYCTYDSRTREFVDTYRIPSFDIDSGSEFRLEDLYRQDLFDAFNAAYHERYAATAAFLDANGMAHKMHRAAPSADTAATLSP